MPADFLANDFAAIARAMRGEQAPPPDGPAILIYWQQLNTYCEVHPSLDAAVATAWTMRENGTGVPSVIRTLDHSVVLRGRTLESALDGYGEGMPLSL